MPVLRQFIGDAAAQHVCRPAGHCVVLGAVVARWRRMWALRRPGWTVCNVGFYADGGQPFGPAAAGRDAGPTDEVNPCRILT